MRGWDFALSLTFVIDILSPIVHAMEKAQSVNSNVWDLVSRTEQLLQDLEEMEASLNSLQVNDLPDVAFISRAHFPLTQKHAAEIAGNKFQGMELKPGWLITSETGGGVEWEESNVEELKNNIVNLISKLRNGLSSR